MVQKILILDDFEPSGQQQAARMEVYIRIRPLALQFMQHLMKEGLLLVIAAAGEGNSDTIVGSIRATLYSKPARTHTKTAERVCVCVCVRTAINLYILTFREV